MLELALFIIPGFLWYHGNYSNHDFKNLDSSQWILIPLFVVCSAALLLFSKTLLFFSEMICEMTSLCFWHYTDFSLAKIENLEISLVEFGLAIVLGILMPLLTRVLDSFGMLKFISFLNPFSQFRTESALSRSLENLMKNLCPIMLVLDDKRVYVGMIESHDYRAGDSGSLSIIPWMSGVVEGGSLKITTNYLEAKESGLESSPFASANPISFAMKRFVSVRGFDLKVFLEYWNKSPLIVSNPELSHYFRIMYDEAEKNRTAELFCGENNKV